MKKIKVLVVDDARFMVKAISDILNSDADIKVIDSAKNGLIALDKIKELKPDVITLDIDMPVMDGITTVRHIMLECPVPVVILSSLFKNGAISFEALRLGVVDFLPKPSGAISKDIHNSKQQIIDRVKIATSINISNIHRIKLVKDFESKLNNPINDRLKHIILLGTTLGGPNTSIRLFSKLPSNLSAAAIIVQEISQKILPAFVIEFNQYTSWNMREVYDGAFLEAGVCYIASNQCSIKIAINADGKQYLKISNSANNPLNKLFSSAAQIFAQNTIGILLTGTGNDGAEGFFHIKERLGTTMAQQSNTCVYPNLTQYAIEAGLVDNVFQEENLANEIETIIKKTTSL